MPGSKEVTLMAISCIPTPSLSATLADMLRTRVFPKTNAALKSVEAEKCSVLLMREYIRHQPYHDLGGLPVIFTLTPVILAAGAVDEDIARLVGKAPRWLHGWMAVLFISTLFTSKKKPAKKKAAKKKK